MATDPVPARSSETLKTFYAWLRKVAPFAWLFATLAGLLALLFRGLEALFEKLGTEAKLVGEGTYVHPSQGDTLVAIAKFVRETAPFSAGLAVVFALVAILCEGLQVIFKGWQSRVETGKNAPSTPPPTE